jgi:glycosyltransferase involved in cell wall biosynthesis
MSAAPAPSVVYVLPDKMGGIASIVANLLAHRRPDGLGHHAVLTHNRPDGETRYGQALSADSQVVFEYSLPPENLRAVLRRLAASLPPGPGVLVSNDWIELAMLAVPEPGRTVIQILHGDHEYYYELARRHETLIDAFVTYGRVMDDALRRLLPHRQDVIFHLPYGVPVPERVRAAAPGPLRLLFCGRLLDQHKGVFDLPQIDARLRAAGVPVRWTVAGGGVDGPALRRRWDADGRVAWLGSQSHAEVQALLPEHDVFVLPTRAEGVPVALVEAMGAGLVPVVSDIPSGIGELVERERTGVLVPVRDVDGFAAAIAGLARDRDRLEAMSRRAREAVSASHDVRGRAEAYQALFARWAELKRPRPRRPTLHYGSRLDVPWLPNGAVVAARRAWRLLGGGAR